MQTKSASSIPYIAGTNVGIYAGQRREPEDLAKKMDEAMNDPNRGGGMPQEKKGPNRAITIYTYQGDEESRQRDKMVIQSKSNSKIDYLQYNPEKINNGEKLGEVKSGGTLSDFKDNVIRDQWTEAGTITTNRSLKAVAASDSYKIPFSEVDDNGDFRLVRDRGKGVVSNKAKAIG